MFFLLDQKEPKNQGLRTLDQLPVRLPFARDQSRSVTAF
jgi:hypothetical protein